MVVIAGLILVFGVFFRNNLHLGGSFLIPVILIFASGYDRRDR
jgi:hypothetical protein